MAKKITQKEVIEEKLQKYIEQRNELENIIDKYVEFYQKLNGAIEATGDILRGLQEEKSTTTTDSMEG